MQPMVMYFGYILWGRGGIGLVAEDEKAILLEWMVCGQSFNIERLADSVGPIRRPLVMLRTSSA